MVPYLQDLTLENIRLIFALIPQLHTLQQLDLLDLYEWTTVVLFRLANGSSSERLLRKGPNVHQPIEYEHRLAALPPTATTSATQRMRALEFGPP